MQRERKAAIRSFPKVISLHTKKLMSVSEVQMGCNNDKTISRHNAAMGRIRAKNDILKMLKFNTLSLMGPLERPLVTTVLLMVAITCGLSLWHLSSMNPMGLLENSGVTLLNPSGKDIECVFGILK
jgi:hypothetical protein